jgi:hypothetical protein
LSAAKRRPVLALTAPDSYATVRKNAAMERRRARRAARHVSNKDGCASRRSISPHLFIDEGKTE